MLIGPGGQGITINPPPATTSPVGDAATQPKYVFAGIASRSQIAMAAAMSPKAAGMPMSRNICSRCWTM